MNIHKPDPRMKYNIRMAIQNALYGKPNKAIEDKAGKIVQRNTILKFLSHNSFMYLGKFYSYNEWSMPRVDNTLAPVFFPEMNKIIEESKELEKEISKVMGYVVKVLNASNDVRNYLLVFPNALHSCILLTADIPDTVHVLLSDETFKHLKEQDPNALLLKQRLFINLLE